MIISLTHQDQVESAFNLTQPLKAICSFCFLKILPPAHELYSNTKIEFSKILFQFMYTSYLVYYTTNVHQEYTFENILKYFQLLVINIYSRLVNISILLLQYKKLFITYSAVLSTFKYRKFSKNFCSFSFSIFYDILICIRYLYLEHLN